MTDITMPRLADSMEEGTILSWLRHDGDAVAAGDELVEIETDKATVSIAAEAEGVLQIRAAEGATLAVGERDRPHRRGEVGAPGAAARARAGRAAGARRPTAAARPPGAGGACRPAAAASARRRSPGASPPVTASTSPTVAGTGPRGRIRTRRRRVAPRACRRLRSTRRRRPAPAIEPTDAPAADRSRGGWPRRGRRARPSRCRPRSRMDARRSTCAPGCATRRARSRRRR